jgi:hypothetical protein
VDKTPLGVILPIPKYLRAVKRLSTVLVSVYHWKIVKKPETGPQNITGLAVCCNRVNHKQLF